MELSFWKGRRVFVTGHTGSRAAGWWRCSTAWEPACTAMALAPEAGADFYRSAGIGALCTSTFGDIRDRAGLLAALRKTDASVLFHLAAQPLVGRARAEPLETFSSNIMGTATVLDTLREVPSVTAAVIVTSDKVYDNVEWAWPYRESDRLGGREPYGASKAACELVANCYRHSYIASGPLRIATARAGNVIGGGDWAEDGWCRMRSARSARVNHW